MITPVADSCSDPANMVVEDERAERTWRRGQVSIFRHGISGDERVLVEQDGKYLIYQLESLTRLFGTGTAGGARVEPSVVRRIGTSPLFYQEAVLGQSLPQAAAKDERASVQRLSPADQVREVMAALSLNKTQLAEVLGVSRPTLYDWLEGKEPNDANAQRLVKLVQLLRNANVAATESISSRFVRQPLNEGKPSLLDLLTADTFDEPRVARVLKEAKELEAAVQAKQEANQQRLRDRGFAEPSDEQRKENLALNMALREWPKG